MIDHTLRPGAIPAAARQRRRAARPQPGAHP
jgi:hypothetical protein